MIAPGKGYNVFAGRDASKALGKSSMKAEDLSADYSELTEWELKVLDDWVAYYTKVRTYNQYGHFSIPSLLLNLRCLLSLN